MKAQFDISYIANRNVRNIDSYTESVEKGQYEVYRLKNGIRIEYTLGDIALTVEDLPKMLSEERANRLILQNNTLSEEEKEYFTICFEQDAKTKAWVWKPNNFGSKVNDVLTVFEKIGYSQTDLTADSKEFDLKYVLTEKMGFMIPVEYTLENGTYRASVILEDIEYPADYPILSLNFCPYFGAATSEKEGYIFLPDGSGVLLDFDQKKHNMSQLDSTVYMVDKVTGKETKDSTTQPVVLPVFGLKTGDNAFLAVIEEGDALGKITAVRAGQNSTYNTVNASFTLRAQDTMDLSSVNAGAAEVSVVEVQPYTGRLTVAYTFLNGSDAGYAGMARSYRKQLLEKGGYTPIHSEKLPLYLETIGGVQSNKNLLGINYQGITTLTSYQNSAEMVSQLEGAGVDNVILRMSGWFNGGYEQQIANKVKPISDLGKTADLNSLLSGGNTYLNVKLLTTATSKGVSLSGQVARTIDQRYARLWNSDRTPGGYILSVNYLPTLTNQLLKGLNRYSNPKLSIADLGNAVYADYTKRKEVSRQKALEILVDQTKRLREASAGKLMLEQANVHTAQYADHVVKAPLDSSGYFAATREVPFYQMVFHGLISYAGNAMNLSGSYETDLLKAAESGAGLYYQLAYNSLTGLSGVLEMDLYSVHYADWVEKCIADYIALNAVIGGLNNQQMIDHQFVTPDCTLTIYEKGTKVAVNYGTQSVLVDGYSVPTHGYIAIQKKGG
jgi:hypothetical protein